MQNCLVSASNIVLVHDLTADAVNDIGYEVAPQTMISNHYMGAKVNSVAYSHTSKPFKSGFYHFTFRYDNCKWRG